MHKFFLPYDKVQFIHTVVIKNTSGPCIRSRHIIYFSVHTYQPHYLGLINCWNWSYFYYNLIFLSSWCDRCCCVQLTAAETVFQIITLACLWNDRPVLSLKCLPEFFWFSMILPSYLNFFSTSIDKTLLCSYRLNILKINVIFKCY